MINVYCGDRGWLFEDLKREIASFGAEASERPIPGADAYICIRTREAHLSPNRDKTVVQVHDTHQYALNAYGMVSMVHPVQAQTVVCKAMDVCPIGSRDIHMDALPEVPTIGFFCREIGSEKGSDVFEQAVFIARRTAQFDVLLMGERLEKIAHLGNYVGRAAGPKDYSAIDALFTASVSPMVPLSAYEALAGGRSVISTPRQWPYDFHGIHTGRTAAELAEHIVSVVTHRSLYSPQKPYARWQWAKRQVQLAEALINA